MRAPGRPEQPPQQGLAARRRGRRSAVEPFRALRHGGSETALGAAPPSVSELWRGGRADPPPV
eukprot:1861601-Rhodomonas_salina.1